MLLRDLQNRTKSAAERPGSGVSSYRKEDDPSGAHVTTSRAFHENMPPKKAPSAEDSPTSDSETEKHPVVTTEIKIVDKSVIEEDIPLQTRAIPGGASKVTVEKYEDNGDEWLEEESIEIGDSRITSIPIGNEDDVSFSDLEEDDEKVPAGSKAVTNASNPQETGSKGWVQLSKSSGGPVKDGKPIVPETKEANEWSDLDDIDMM